MEYTKINETINELFEDSKNDYLKMIGQATKAVFRPMQPSDFKNVYLSISKDEGDGLENLIKENQLKNIVEFGTSFGISTLFLAKGVLETNGTIVTTELIESKALTAIENFKRAGVHDLIEVRIGNAIDTLRNYNQPIDLLFLDGWKDLYLAVFELLEPNFHKKTIVYVDNANMRETQRFLKAIDSKLKYELTPKYGGKVYLVTLKS